MSLLTDWRLLDSLCIAIEKYPSLYDPKNKNYKCFKMRPVIFKNIADELDETWTGEKVKEWFTKIQASRQREKERMTGRSVKIA
jgi:hypothetical protein